MTDGPIRALTRRQAEIAHGIGRNLSYREIGCELGLREQTISGYVKAMALIFDSSDAFPPRQRIFVWVKRLEWDCKRKLSVDELIIHSADARKRYMDSLHGAGVAGIT
jgi:hypothetical protein